MKAACKITSVCENLFVTVTWTRRRCRPSRLALSSVSAAASASPEAPIPARPPHIHAFPSARVAHAALRRLRCTARAPRVSKERVLDLRINRESCQSARIYSLLPASSRVYTRPKRNSRTQMKIDASTRTQVALLINLRLHNEMLQHLSGLLRVANQALDLPLVAHAARLLEMLADLPTRLEYRYLITLEC